MPHYKKFFDDKEHLYAFDLDGREVTVQIEKAYGGELQGEKGRKSKKPMLKFVGKTKLLALNRTNGRTIATLYGPDTDDWVGKWVTLYPTTTDFGGETVECIRVRPNVPNGKSAGKNGRSKAQQTEDAIREKMAETGVGELTDEDKRAIAAAEAAESK